MAWYGGSTSDLNNIFKQQWLDSVVRANKIKMLLMERWYPRVKNASEFQTLNDKYIIPVETFSPYAGGGRAEAGDMTSPAPPSYAQATAGVFEVTSVAGLTEEARKGKSDAVVKEAARSLERAAEGYRLQCNMLLHGDGTGRLAQVASYAAGPPATVTVDNTRANFGWAGCAMLYPGLKVDIITWGDATKNTYGVTITSVDRAAGTFTIGATADYGGTLGTDGSAPQDNDIVVLSGMMDSKTSFRAPFGLLSLVDDGSITTTGPGQGNGSWYDTTFMGLDRTAAANSFLRAQVWKADDWASGGSAGTLADFDLSDITGRIDLMEFADTSCEITCMLMSPSTEQCINRKARLETTAVTQIGADNKVIPGWYTPVFMHRGRKIPIFIINTIPDNTIYFLDESKLLILKEFDETWWEYNGSKPWFQPGNRNLTYEAWLRGKWNLVATRCDCFGRMEDLDTTT